jgi:hypothetical protein
MIVSHYSAKQVLEKGWEIAQMNIRINGATYDAVVDGGEDGELGYLYVFSGSQNTQKGMEPWDEALDRKIWALAATRMQWHGQVATTRRTAPKEIEKSLQSALQELRDAESRELESVVDDPMEEEEELPDDGASFSLCLRNECLTVLPQRCSRICIPPSWTAGRSYQPPLSQRTRYEDSLPFGPLLTLPQTIAIQQERAERFDKVADAVLGLDCQREG